MSIGVVFVRIRQILVDFLARDAILYTLRERTTTTTPRSNGSNSVSGDGRGGCLTVLDQVSTYQLSRKTTVSTY